MLIGRGRGYPKAAPDYQSYTADASAAARSSATFSHTTPAGARRCLVVTCHLGTTGSDPTVSSITYGGVAMTAQVTGSLLSGGVYYRSAIYTLVNPPAGAANVVVTLSGNAEISAFVAASYQYVTPSNPVIGTDTDSGTDTAVGDLIFGEPTQFTCLVACGAAAYGANPITPGGGDNERVDAVINALAYWFADDQEALQISATLAAAVGHHFSAIKLNGG